MKKRLIKEGLIKERELYPVKIELKAIDSKIKDTEKSIQNADNLIREAEAIPDYTAIARQMIAEEIAEEKAEKRERAARCRRPTIYLVGIFIIEDYGRTKPRVFKRRNQ